MGSLQQHVAQHIIKSAAFRRAFRRLICLMRQRLYSTLKKMPRGPFELLKLKPLRLATLKSAIRNA